MTAAPPTECTAASQLFFMAASFMAASFESPAVRDRRGAAAPHGELDGVPRAVCAYMHGVHHVTDEEQPPSARLLLAFQLQQQVLLLCRPLRLVLSPEVRYGHDYVVAVLVDL